MREIAIPKFLNVILLLGGISAEREISIISGKQVARALRSLGHDVFESDISPNDLSGLDHKFRFRSRPKVVFPVLHGIFGEDGQIQQILENRNLPFVGTGSHASRITMDKYATKCYLSDYDIPTPNCQIVLQHSFGRGWELNEKIAGDGPWMLKPISEGSSVGCKKCIDLDEMLRHLQDTLPKYGSMMIEKFITGLELTVGIFGERALPVIWIKPATGFYDYQAKYTSNDTQYIFDDIPLDKEVLLGIQDLAVKTHSALGCRHLSRIDFMVDEKTNLPYVLEINTMPGFTSHSLLPMAAKKAGMSLPWFCDTLARMAIEDAKRNLEHTA